MSVSLVAKAQKVGAADRPSSRGAGVVEVLEHVLGIDERDDRVQEEVAAELVIEPKNGGDRPRVCHACGLDEHIVELVTLGHDALKGVDELVPHGAADASIVHLVALLKHFAPNALGCDSAAQSKILPKFVLNDRNALAVVGRQNPAHISVMVFVSARGSRIVGNTR